MAEACCNDREVGQTRNRHHMIPIDWMHTREECDFRDDKAFTQWPAPVPKRRHMRTADQSGPEDHGPDVRLDLAGMLRRVLRTPGAAREPVVEFGAPVYRQVPTSQRGGGLAATSKNTRVWPDVRWEGSLAQADRFERLANSDVERGFRTKEEAIDQSVPGMMLEHQADSRRVRSARRRPA